MSPQKKPNELMNHFLRTFEVIGTHRAIACSKLTIETLERVVKYVQS